MERCKLPEMASPQTKPDTEGPPSRVGLFTFNYFKRTSITSASSVGLV